MKRRVGKYKDKIIVEGDKNEFKPHEVSIKELAGTNNEGGGDSNLIYYKFKPYNNEIAQSIELYCVVLADKVNFVTSADGFKNHYFGPGGFISIAYLSDKRTTLLAIGASKYIRCSYGEGTLENIINAIFKNEGIDVNVSDYIEPITEEEFYNIKPE